MSEANLFSPIQRIKVCIPKKAQKKKNCNLSVFFESVSSLPFKTLDSHKDANIDSDHLGNDENSVGQIEKNFEVARSYARKVTNWLQNFQTDQLKSFRSSV